jgi:hypothetical protein
VAGRRTTSISADPRTIKRNLKKGREAAATSFITEIQEIQEAPHDGGTIIPKDA